MSEQIKSMKETLISAVMSRMGDLNNTNAKELGEVIDMIKDLEEAEYYCTVTKAMNEHKDKDNSSDKMDMILNELRSVNRGQNYFTNYPYDAGWRDPRYDSWDYDKMYSEQRKGYTDRVNVSTTIPSGMRDYREGMSPMRRKGYMETKEMHMDKNVQMKELEKYMRDLGTDITDMISDASPEEKKMLKDKLTELAQKIA